MRSFPRFSRVEDFKSFSIDRYLSKLEEEVVDGDDESVINISLKRSSFIDGV
jgi:hypothetical protein